MSGTMKTTSLGLICFLAIVVSGCVKTSMLYRGNTVSSVPVVTLQEDFPNAGTWETFELVIDYEYLRNGDFLEITGEVALTQHYHLVYDRLRHLYVYLFFVDQNSQVLETHSFVDNLTGSTEERLRVSRRYKIPIGATGISFGYDGAADDWDSHTSFYELPLRK